MKKSGYDQFFKEAKKNANSAAPARSISVEKLRENMNNKKAKKPKRKFPLMQFVVFLFCGAGLFLVIENFDKIETTLQKLEIGVSVAQAETAQPAQNLPVAPAVPTTTPVVSAVTSGTVKAETDSEDADYIYKLTERKKVLDQREEELNKKAADVEAQKAIVEKKLKDLEDYRQKISSMLQERIKTDDTKIDTLVQVYTNMKPVQAAKIFETMDEDLVIEILSRMKKKSAADILNLVKTDKAQTFAERYAGYRVPSSIPKPDAAATAPQSQQQQPSEPSQSEEQPKP